MKYHRLHTYVNTYTHTHTHTHIHTFFKNRFFSFLRSQNVLICQKIKNQNLTHHNGSSLRNRKSSYQYTRRYNKFKWRDGRKKQETRPFVELEERNNIPSNSNESSLVHHSTDMKVYTENNFVEKNVVLPMPSSCHSGNINYSFNNCEVTIKNIKNN